MNNHVHLIASSLTNKLEDVMRDLKKFTSRQIMDAIQDNDKESRKNWMMWLFSEAAKNNENNTHRQFWQQDNHPIVLVTNTMIQQKLSYIHDNPVRAGIVFEPSQYVYSSAVDYYNIQEGLLPIQLLF